MSCSRLVAIQNHDRLHHRCSQDQSNDSTQARTDGQRMAGDGLGRCFLSTVTVHSIFGGQKLHLLASKGTCDPLSGLLVSHAP